MLLGTERRVLLHSSVQPAVLPFESVSERFCVFPSLPAFRMLKLGVVCADTEDTLSLYSSQHAPHSSLRFIQSHLPLRSASSSVLCSAPPAPPGSSRAALARP